MRSPFWIAVAGLLLLDWNGGGQAAILSVKATCDYEQILANQPFQFQVEVTTDGETPPVPQLPTMNALMVQRDQQVEQSLLNFNGNIKKTYTYHFIAQTSQVGVLQIAGIEAGGVQANPLTIQVVDPKTQVRKEGETPPIFVEAVVDKKEVWQGEQILFDFFIYDRVGGLRDLNAPGLETGLKDFIFKRVEDPSSPPRKTLVNGQSYTKIHGIRYALFPLKSGEFEIPPIQLKARVELRSDAQDSFFSLTRARRVPVEQITGRAVMTEPISVKVKDLPAEGRPMDFSGAVGNFSFKAELSRPEVTVGESVTLHVTIIGNANFDTIAEPSLTLPPEIEKYDVEKEAKVDFGGDLLRGIVDYDFILIPRQEGELIIDRLKFSYFDPKDAEYRTLERGPFQLKVKPDEGQSITYHKGKRKRIRVTGQDFRHIRRTGAVDLRNEGAPITASIGYWSVVTAPWVGYFFLVVYRRRQEFFEANPEVAKKVRSKGKLKERWARASSLIEGNESEFFAELEKAIFDHLTAHVGASARGMTRPQLAETLAKTKSGRDFAESMSDLLDQLDALRYAPGETSPGVRRNLLAEVKAKLERFQA